MYIKTLKIKDFRNYEVLDLEFDKKVNIIIGSNAQGKTNLLESIYISSLGRSLQHLMARWESTSAAQAAVCRRTRRDKKRELLSGNLIRSER